MPDMPIGNEEALNEELDMDMGIDVITLTDENGVDQDFEILDQAEFEGGNYMALAPIPENPDELLEDSGEMVILKVIEDDGEEFLEIIEDEDEFDRVGAFFTERLSETYDFDTEDSEDDED